MQNEGREPAGIYSKGRFFFNSFLYEPAKEGTMAHAPFGEQVAHAPFGGGWADIGGGHI